MMMANRERSYRVDVYVDADIMKMFVFSSALDRRLRRSINKAQILSSSTNTPIFKMFWRF